jgi:hypothetical protein
MPELTPELLVLPLLSIAAGVDLYLTLLFLGAAPTTTWWDQPLPGALGDLNSLGVMLLVGMFYLLEFTAERFPTAALVWNAFHAVIRPLSGALLALLLLDGQPPLVIATGALASGALAATAHAARSGSAIMAWLGARETPHPLLVSLVEDVAVLGMVALVIDQPTWAFFGGLLILAAGAFGSASRIRAFFFAIRLATGRVFQGLGAARWTDSSDFPEWVRAAFDDDIMAPGGGLRGNGVGAHGLPGAPRFAHGWVVVRGDSPAFVYRKWRGTTRIDLAGLPARDVVETGFFRRVDLGPPGDAPACIFFGVNGPSTESLRAEFLFD